jgi:TPR repeat protein
MLPVAALAFSTMLACETRHAPAKPGLDAAVAAAAPLVHDAAPAPAPDAAPVHCDPADLAACVTAADGVRVADPGQAAKIYKQACDGGVVAGCLRLGQATEGGRGATRDLAGAVAIYSELCEAKKNLEACAMLGTMYEDGKGVKADTAKAIALYTRACDGGAGLGCTGLGTLQAMGQGLPVDTAKALTFFKKACDAGEPVGCLRLGRAYQRGLGTEAQGDQADKVWAKLQADLPARCDAGDARACDVFGVIRHQGLGSDSEVTAAEHIFHACELGYARACAESAALTAMKANGAQVARTLVEQGCAGGDDLSCALFGKLLVNANQVPHALELFAQACSGGGETGCVDLAGLYDSGGPVPEDRAKATTYYQRACEGGSFRGCLGLGSRLNDGIGAKKDPKGARAAADKACKIEPSTCWMMGRYLATGVGGAVDLEQAKKLYTVSCAAGEETACPYREHPIPEPDAGVTPPAPKPAASEKLPELK